MTDSKSCCDFPSYITDVGSVGPLYVEMHYCETCGNIGRLETYVTGSPVGNTRNAHLGRWKPADKSDS